MDTSKALFENIFISGLVIALPAGVRSLFNPQVHRLVRAVEGRLDNVFVTFASGDESEPGIKAAVNATRFAGCSSAVVVHSDDVFSQQGWIDSKSDTFWSVSHDSAEIDEAARRVVEVFNAVRTDPSMVA